MPLKISKLIRDLNAAMVAKINSVYNMGEIFEASYDIKPNSIGIKLKTGLPGVTFQIYTDAEITDSTTNSKSMNNLLKNFTADSFEGTEAFRSGFVDVYPLRNIYLTCSGLGNFNTVSLSGDRNIIKQIPVNARNLLRISNGFGLPRLQSSNLVACLFSTQRHIR